MNRVQMQLSADLHEAVRKCDCVGAIGKIETLRNERRYHIHSFQGLDVGALFRVVDRYTDTTIEVETAGNGTDRHVVVSKESAELLSEVKSAPGAATASAPDATSWLTLRNALALLMAIVSLSNLFLESGFLSQLLAWALGWHPSSPAASLAKANATEASGKPPQAKPGFSLF